MKRGIVERSPVGSFHFVLGSPYKKMEQMEHLKWLDTTQKKIFNLLNVLYVRVFV